MRVIKEEVEGNAIENLNRLVSLARQGGYEFLSCSTQVSARFQGQIVQNSYH